MLLNLLSSGFIAVHRESHCLAPKWKTQDPKVLVKASCEHGELLLIATLQLPHSHYQEIRLLLIANIDSVLSTLHGLSHLHSHTDPSPCRR